MVSPCWPAASHLQALAAEAGLMAAEASTEGGGGGEGGVSQREGGSGRSTTRNMFLDSRIGKGIEIECYISY